ncbi:MAG: CDP-alcohol phosphatidyltransferase family protein [Phyllobacteriaceae bacterium]|nr:CDP-alcohol phosphatidyltransferase family protein [Phyllobacteriaceae bacterium]
MASNVTIPNLISVARLVMVPLTVDALVAGRYDVAFWVFLIAGVSDGIDGWIARRFDQRSELGAYLDPLADKALVVSIFVTLAVMGPIPVWLVILVVSRDVLIVGGVMLSWMLSAGVPIRPLFVSKANTMAQIAFAALVLGSGAFGFDPGRLWVAGEIAVATLTTVSGLAYLVDWLRVMSSAPGDPGRAAGRREGDDA